MFIIYAIIIFCLLIFVHEFGHLIAAKATGIKVNEFALGMGPTLLKKQWGETKYSLRALPIGGYCAMEGEDEESDDPRGFNNKSMPRKAIVLVAGSLMNLLLAIIILGVVVFAVGTPSTMIEDVPKDTPAYEAGVRAGDDIVAINGTAVDSWDDITDAIAGTKSDSIVLKVERDGENKELTSGFYEAEDGSQKVGITPAFERTPMHAIKSIGYGGIATWEMTKEMFHVLGGLFTGEFGVNDLTGPVGIVNAVGDTAKMGLIYVAQLTALISLNLAIINMLPLPALDGGKLLFLVIRKLTGKTISDETENKIHFIGFMLLMLLMIYITVIDIDRFIL